jgi:hypothetical protein
LESALATEPDLSDAALAAYPADVAARLSALRELGESLGARRVGFGAWRRIAYSCRFPTLFVPPELRLA